MVWAAAQGRIDSVALLAELGFDVNAKGRGDAPLEQPWETPLHEAASRGDVGTGGAARRSGRRPVATRRRGFDATPLGWARYFDQPAVAAFLGPMTPDGSEPG